MSKPKDLQKAKAILSTELYAKYAEWRNSPWVVRFPYLATFIIEVESILIFILLIFLIGRIS